MDVVFAEEIQQVGYLGSFLANSLKTNQLEVKTDSRTLRPIARLREPRDLFALPKERENDNCAQQQAPRWPTECQVIEERIRHIERIYQTEEPEEYYQPTGKELQPRPVGEENGTVVFDYTPFSAVHYATASETEDEIPIDNLSLHDYDDYDFSSDSSQLGDGDPPMPPPTPPAEIGSNGEWQTVLDDESEIKLFNNPNDQLVFSKKPQQSLSECDSGEWRTEKIEFPNDSSSENSFDYWGNMTPGRLSFSPRHSSTPSVKFEDSNHEHSSSEWQTDVDEFIGKETSNYWDHLTPVRLAFSPRPPSTPSVKFEMEEETPSEESNYKMPFSFWERFSPSRLAFVARTPSSTPSVQFEDTNFGASRIDRNNNPIDCCDNLSWNDLFTASSRENSEFSDKTTSTSNDDYFNNFDPTIFKTPTPTPPPRKSKKWQFSRSAPGGSKYLLSVHPNSLEEEDLIFESRFESGNLTKAVKITPTYYELYLRPDMYTNRHTQWFYFRVKNMRIKTTYRFSIVNLTKPDSLYREGMRPLMYSTKEAELNEIGWRRCGTNISYFRNEDNNYNNNNYTKLIDDFDDEEPNTNWSFTLTFNIEFQHADDTVFFAHSYPYTYSDLQDYLLAIQKHPIKSKFCKLRLLCRSLAGNNVYNLTVTSPSIMEEDNREKKKKAIIMTARVHPGESPSSWMMKGFMDFITGDSYVAKKLRHKFIFKIIPMLNPDGVIVGNTRSSLTGRDLNRQYRTVIRETYPSIWNTKAMIKRLMEDCGVALYCDMHAHSRKHNIFIYGCENLKRHPDRRLLEQVFPLMLHKNVADKFSFENCKFRVQKTKEGCGRIVVWVLGVTNSYTLEASFSGSTLGSRNGTHFSISDYEHIGRAFCETLMDFYDDSQVKEKLRNKILTRLLEQLSNADFPQNIPLSDYSSDEGETSSGSSENEGGKDSKSDYECDYCQPLKVPPCSPVLPMKTPKNMKKAKNQNKATRNLFPRKPRKYTRQVMDIPSTDPASDFFEVSSDEELADDDSGALPRFSNHLKTRSNDYLKAVASYCESQTSFMPPELIITSTKDTDPNFAVGEAATSNQNLIRDFPPISKRTRSWHSCRSATRIRNINLETGGLNTAENLQMKLTLKKQVWTGSFSGEKMGNVMEMTRPLSWGNSKSSQYYDCDTVLAACSRKLGVLQVQEKDTLDNKMSDLLKSSNQMSPSKVLLPSASKNPRDSEFPKLMESKPLELSEKSNGFLNKSKRKTRTTFSKIVKTTDILAKLTKTTQSFGFKQREAITVPRPNKFKTSGLAVTAVTRSKTKPKTATTQSGAKIEIKLDLIKVTRSPTEKLIRAIAPNRKGIKRSKSKEQKNVASRAKVKT